MGFADERQDQLYVPTVDAVAVEVSNAQQKIAKPIFPRLLTSAAVAAARILLN